MNRRGFLQSCLALASAPAIVKAERIMRIWTPPQEIILARDFAILNPGQWHRVGVQYSWLGVGKTRFFLDGKEVPGIAGMQFKQADGSFSVGIDEHGPLITTPRYEPGKEFHCEATIKLDAPRSFDVQGVMVESEGRQPLIYTPQPVQTASFKSEDWVAPKMSPFTKKLLERI